MTSRSALLASSSVQQHDGSPRPSVASSRSLLRRRFGSGCTRCGRTAAVIKILLRQLPLLMIGGACAYALYSTFMSIGPSSLIRGQSLADAFMAVKTARIWPGDPDAKTTSMPNGKRVQLRLAGGGRYLRVDAATGGVFADLKSPWLHGSTFELFEGAEGAYQLLSRAGGGFLQVPWAADGAPIVAGASQASPSAAFTRVQVGGGAMQLRARSGGYAAVDADDNAQRLVARTAAGSAAAFEVEELQPLIGVNLGAWLSPEGWLTADMPLLTPHKHDNLPQSLCAVVQKYGSAAAEAIFKDHVDNFIRECDFDYIRDHGFTAVRLPVGWWSVISPSEAPPTPRTNPPWQQMAPADVNTSLAAMDRVFEWAEARGLQVLLDMHGAPGSQNGKLHSGCALGTHFVWHTSSSTIRLTEEAIRRLVERYGRRKAFYGIELLNEPGAEVKGGPGPDGRLSEASFRPRLLEFYHNCYRIVRAVSDEAVVVFNTLYWYDFWAWASELREPDYYNVVMDQHLYAETLWKGDHPTGIFQANHMGCHIRQHEAYHPVIVGEWALHAPLHGALSQSWVNAQVRAMLSAYASFYWTLKADRLAPIGGPGPRTNRLSWDATVAIDHTPGAPWDTNRDWPSLAVLTNLSGRLNASARPHGAYCSGKASNRQRQCERSCATVPSATRDLCLSLCAAPPTRPPHAPERVEVTEGEPEGELGHWHEPQTDVFGPPPQCPHLPLRSAVLAGLAALVLLVCVLVLLARLCKAIRWGYQWQKASRTARFEDEVRRLVAQQQRQQQQGEEQLGQRLLERREPGEPREALP